MQTTKKTKPSVKAEHREDIIYGKIRDRAKQKADEKVWKVIDSVRETLQEELGFRPNQYVKIKDVSFEFIDLMNAIGFLAMERYTDKYIDEILNQVAKLNEDEN